jgi:hypothetical protein
VFYPLAFFGILVNSLLALVVLLALLGRLDVPLLSGLKQSPFQPLAVALGLHWFFYFGPINLGAILLNSEVQNNYAWIVRKPLMAQASLASLIAYPLLLLVLAGLAWWLRQSPLARRWQGLPVVPVNQLVVVAALMAVMAVLIAPYIATRSADAGAFYEKVPLFFSPFVKGLFPLEAIPLLAASLRVFSLPRPAAADGEAPRYIAVAGLQILTFILLRQRFLTLLAVVLAGLVMARWLRRRQLVVGVPIGLLLAYAIPTALRFGRYPPRPGQPHRTEPLKVAPGPAGQQQLHAAPAYGLALAALVAGFVRYVDQSSGYPLFFAQDLGLAAYRPPAVALLRAHRARRRRTLCAPVFFVFGLVQQRHSYGV